MRIARPSRPKAPFKRKRGPPPQATKLLTYSLAAGIVFMILLGIVFLPRMFPGQAPVAVVRNRDWRFDTTSGTKLYIENITASLELDKFRADFRTNGVVIAHLNPGLAGGNATLEFVDANVDGLLNAGDYFAISPPPSGCYRLELFQVEIGKLAGFKEWGGCPSATFN